MIGLRQCSVCSDMYAIPEEAQEELCWIIMEENGYVETPICKACLETALEELKEAS